MSYRPPTTDRDRTQPYVTAPPPPPAPLPPRRPRRGDDNWSPGAFSPGIFLVAMGVIALLVGVAVLGQRAVTGDRPAATATSPNPGAGQPSTTATPRPTGRFFTVGNTGGEGVFLRNTPRLEDRIRPAYGDGTRLEQIGPDVTGEGQTWRHVRAPDGKTGYVPARYTIEAR